MQLNLNLVNHLYRCVMIALVGLGSILLADRPAFSTSKSNNPVNSRMAEANSPYLHSHKKDLVQWYGWGEEAFKLAAERNIPVMVSFGYSACHWCHVMQENHFNDPDISKKINQYFVPILVDRERRTALDETYMLVTEVLTQTGGWPNTVFMTPERKPFYGTGYLPPKPFNELLDAAIVNWRDQLIAVLSESERISTLIANYQTRTEQAKSITPDVLQNLSNEIVSQFDPLQGGMGEAPKFFQPTVLMFLLQRYANDGDEAALEAVTTTLNAIQLGGIHDHLEGGFHRYAIDPAWRIPHFEKMLYDQAQMSEVYLEAYRLTGNISYADTARKTLQYVANDLLDDMGGFYSTRDADSEGEEGTYYVWSSKQLTAALGEDSAQKAIGILGAISEGEFADKIILNLDNADETSLPFILQTFEKLKSVRASREKPKRDQKIIASWNGMMISSFAKASGLLQNPAYKTIALKAGEFVWHHMRDENGALHKSYFNANIGIVGELEDYSQVARAFIDLYDLTNSKKWLDRAIKLDEAIQADFADKKNGDFYATKQLQGFAKAKLRADSDQPSGNGVALDVMAKRAKRSSDKLLAFGVEKTMAALSGVAIDGRTSGASILAAADRYLRNHNGRIHYAGEGAVKISADYHKQSRQLVLRLDVKDGWHVNANKPLEGHLIPTKLQILVDNHPYDASISYPDPEVKSLNFNHKPMALLEGRIDLAADLHDYDLSVVDAQLTVQTCSNKICLLPEDIKIRLPVAR